MRNFLIAVLIAALCGCASSGPKIDSAQLAALRAGKTTAAEIYSRFGRPSFLSRNMDGTQTAVYVHSDDKGGTTIVPVIDSLAGKTNAGSETVTFHFDEKGLLTDYKVTQASTVTAAPEAAPAAAAKTATESAAKTAQPPADTPLAAGGTAAAPAATQTAGAKSAPAAAAQPAKSNSIFLNLPSFLPSATRDPRNPQ